MGTVPAYSGFFGYSKPLRRAMRIDFSGLDPVWLRFKYERLPRFCYFCGKLGHNEKDCALLLRAKEEGEQASNSLGYISAGPARDLDLGTNSPSAPSASLTASLVGAAEMIGLVSVDVTATKVCDLQNHHYTPLLSF